MTAFEIGTTTCPLSCQHESNTDDIENSSNGSVDTQEAILDMLGLGSSDGFPSDENIEEVEDSFQQKFPQHKQILLPKRCSRYLLPSERCLAFTIDNFCSKLECNQLIQRAATSTARGFQYIKEAAHITPDGESYFVRLQNPNHHKLSLFYHLATISRMWKKLEPLILPLIEPFIERVNCGPPLGLNPKLRVLRYDSCDKDRFEPHFDATTIVGDKKSLLTVLLYLNDSGGKDFEGGETLYLDSHISSSRQIESAMSRSNDNIEMVTPETGKVVIFEHDLFHASNNLISGTKFVLRTDVLFANEGNDPTTNVADGVVEMIKSQEVCLLVSDVCRDLGLSPEVIERLNAMDMLEMTVESFLAPGITILKMMLLDEIFDSETVDQIVHMACKAIK
jgi:hypothetical protein